LEYCMKFITLVSYLSVHCCFVFFFFQAEDGIRDRNVTGVQTCALPIYQKELHPRSLIRKDGGIFWKYWASKKDCKSCPLQSKCLTRKGSLTARYLLDNYFRSPVQKNIAQKESPEYRKALKKRQIWCEGTFAAQKWGHNLKRLLRRGLEAATDHCLLSATAINFKRMIKYMG